MGKLSVFVRSKELDNDKFQLRILNTLPLPIEEVLRTDKSLPYVISSPSHSKPQFIKVGNVR